MNRSKTFVPYYTADRNFFLLLLILIWAAIASGFGFDMARLSSMDKLHFSPIVQIHIVVYITWLLLFTLQILLIRTKNLALHKKLGLASLGLIPLMVLFGFLTAYIVAKRDYGTPNSDISFICVQFGNVFMFTVLAGMGLYLRKNYVAHKRLMLLATMVLTEPGFSRWFSYKIAPFFGDYFWNYKTLGEGYGHFWIFEVLPQLILILSLGVYDFVTRKKLSKAYIWGSLFFVLVTGIEGFLYYSNTWHDLMKKMIGVA